MSFVQHIVLRGSVDMGAVAVREFQIFYRSKNVIFIVIINWAVMGVRLITKNNSVNYS